MEKSLVLKCLQIGSVVISILTVTCAVVLFTLALTSLKPIRPLLTVYPLGVVSLTREEFTAAGNANATVVVGVDNRNNGGFEFGNATGHVWYDGEAVGEVRVAGGKVPARSVENFPVTATVWVSALRRNPRSEREMNGGGGLDLTLGILLEGTVRIFSKELKLEGPVYGECSMGLDFRSPS